MRGRIVFNGNMGSPSVLMERARPYLVSVGQRRRATQVELCMAAWGQGEHHDGPIREALNAIGVESRWEGGFDQNIQNLSVWHRWREYLADHPDVAAIQQEADDAAEAIRTFYLESTAFHAEQIRRGIDQARAKLPGFALGSVPMVRLDRVRPDGTTSGADLLRDGLTGELQTSIANLCQNDLRMLDLLDQAEAMVPARSGLRHDPDWQRLRAELERRILDADVLFFFGGSPTSLLGALRFFDLRSALLETLRRGATFVTISAGSLVMCERIIVYDNFAGDRLKRDFWLLDRGLGLVGGLQVLPHCMDRIQTDDADNLAYLARRFATHRCVGLNEESFLLVDQSVPRAVSVGTEDGVYVFGPNGQKNRYDHGQEIPL